MSDVIELYLGSRVGGWAIDGVTQAWASHASAPQALHHWAGAIEEARARRWRTASVTLWLSGGLARPFLCGPVAGLTNWREAQAMAAAVAPEATGLSGPCHVRLEGWPGDTHTMATAIEPSLWHAIEEVQRSRRVAWRSVRPRWALLVDEVLSKRPSANLIALLEEDAMTVLSGATAASDGGSATTHAPAPTQDRVEALWNRAMLSRDVQPHDAWFACVERPASGQDSAAGNGDRAQQTWLRAVRDMQASTP